MSEKTKVFVAYVLQRISSGGDTGFSAKLRRADNQDTEYQSWEILSKWVDLENEKERKAYGLIAASLAKGTIENDGIGSIGVALRRSFFAKATGEDIVKSTECSRLQRLLSCRDSFELLGILRSLLRYLDAKGIDYSRVQLLDEILWFDSTNQRDRIRAGWAQGFFRKEGDAE
ncbi:MAG: type I-E CRISPR-associated protein Cse2/CasB [Sphaerochaeta sp.]|nr:type I-E CRISPR-associated protein Cse2/CasB [Sphaerochaeta sp.]